MNRPFDGFTFVIAGLALALVPAAALAAEAPLGVPADGPTFRGELIAIEAEPSLELRFDGPGGPHKLALADLAAWGGFVESTGGAQIVLSGGGMIVVEAPTIDLEQLRGQSRLFGKVALPLKAVAGVIFQRPRDPARGDPLLARVGSLTGQTDRALLDNGDELSGTIAELDPAMLKLTTDAGAVDLEIAKVAAVIFNPILIDNPKLSGMRVLVGFRDGSRVTAISLSADNNSARITLAGGVELTAPTDSIVALLPLGGRVVYLSDLKPESYRHIPFLQLTWPFAADQSVLGAQLRAGGRLYAKGLGMHSPARITYDLDGPYKRFDAEVAIDAEAGPRGSVVFRVFTDDGGGWQERAKTEIIRGGQPPVPITVDLAQARRISLLVDFADRGDEQDHADWLNARLVR